MFIDTFPFQKCLETKETTKSLAKIIFCQGIWSFLMFIDTFPFSKVSGNSKTTKSLEIMTFLGGWSFLLFLDTFRVQGFLLFLHFLDTFGSGPLRAEKREKFTRGNFTLPLGTLLDPLGTLLDLLGTLLDPLGTLLDPLGTLLQYTGPYWTLLQKTGPVGYSTGTCCHLKSCSSSRDAFPN